MKLFSSHLFVVFAAGLSLAACAGASGESSGNNSSSGTSTGGTTTGQGLSLTAPPEGISEPPASYDATLNGNVVGNQEAYGQDDPDAASRGGGQAGSAESDAAATSPIRGPDGSYWRKEGVSQTQHQADIEACFDYAWAQTRHDVRISDDRAAARGDRASTSSGLTDTRRNFDLQDQKRRVGPLMEDCMTGRGYLRI
ncbi:MAG: hypothetical protein AAF530_08965 [Pseudomonadota bacterium]